MLVSFCLDNSHPDAICLTVGLIGMPLMPCDVQCLFLSLTDHLVSSLKKRLFQSLAQFSLVGVSWFGSEHPPGVSQMELKVLPRLPQQKADCQHPPEEGALW